MKVYHRCRHKGVELFGATEVQGCPYYRVANYNESVGALDDQ